MTDQATFTLSVELPTHQTLTLARQKRNVKLADIHPSNWAVIIAYGLQRINNDRINPALAALAEAGNDIRAAKDEPPKDELIKFINESLDVLKEAGGLARRTPGSGVQTRAR